MREYYENLQAFGLESKVFFSQKLSENFSERRSNWILIINIFLMVSILVKISLEILFISSQPTNI